LDIAEAMNPQALSMMRQVIEAQKQALAQGAGSGGNGSPKLGAAIDALTKFREPSTRGAG
jgi:hypothetical protein